MALALPSTRPRLSSHNLRELVKPFNLNREKHPLLLVGIRGYYMRTMGTPTANDRGIYDDALFIDSPNTTASFNGNTDPSILKRGFGKSERTKGIAKLKPGLWLAHRFGNHKGYPALIQTGGTVTVTRDGNPDYDDTGFFGINIHKGGYNTTSSHGCQTIHPDQWRGFITLVTTEAKRLFGEKWNAVTIPYLLIESKES